MRDYLGIRSDQKVHWRFVDAAQVPHGPWKKYGVCQEEATDPDLEAQRRYLEYLKKLQDDNYMKKPIGRY